LTGSKEEELELELAMELALAMATKDSLCRSQYLDWR
jgi:hypothetical protein